MIRFHSSSGDWSVRRTDREIFEGRSRICAQSKISDLLYAVFLGVAGLLGVTLFVLAGRLAHRRRTLPHTLIAVALGALAGRSLVGITNFLGVVDYDLHHLFEHGLDALIVVVLFGAVIAMGRPDTSSGDESKL